MARENEEDIEKYKLIKELFKWNRIKESFQKEWLEGKEYILKQKRYAKNLFK